MTDIDKTIAKINEACASLTTTYTNLATAARPALDSLNGSIGRLTQWECMRTGPRGSSAPFYRDTRPDWFEQMFEGIQPIKEVPDPRADEARKAAAELFGTIGANDQEFGADVADIVATPTAVAAMMAKWLRVADLFSKEVDATIPSNPTYIHTSGGLEGWVGDAATNAYGVTVSSQNGAAATTQSVMRSLLEQCAAFLSSMTKSLADLAGLALAQEEFYGEICKLPYGKDLSFDLVMEVIAAGIDTANTLKRNELAASKAMGTMLTDTIHAILKLVELDAQVTTMGEGDPGWPGPAPMRVVPSPATPSVAQLRWNADYFHDHSVFWNTVSYSLSTCRSKADASTPIPVMFTRIPTFTADRSEGLNNLDARIARDALGLGSINTQRISDLLVATMKQYLANEAANADLAATITQDVFG